MSNKQAQQAAALYRTNLRGEVVTINDRYLGPKEVSEKCSFHRSSIYRLMDKGEFPPSHKISSGRVVWLEADIEEFMRLGAENFKAVYGQYLQQAHSQNS